jgi:hypothetical protein
VHNESTTASVPPALAFPDVGFSTGALHFTDPLVGVAATRRLGSGTIELSALHEDELTAVEATSAGSDVDGFLRVSIHGPAIGRILPESQLVDRLAATGRDVVMHPDTLLDWSLWEALGPRLLIENMDQRKSFGQTPLDLDRVFAALPQARFCLDVSHALSAGDLPLVIGLAEQYADRLAELHVGCACGRDCDEIYEPDLVGATQLVWSIAGRQVPLILERKTVADDTTLAAQLAAFTR